MSERNTFDGKTVVLAGAGCPAGDALASGFAKAGGRVIAIDRNERRVLESAARDPERIDPLRLDVLAADQTRMFADIWEAEPLDVLIHLQPLRHKDELGAAITSILTLMNHLRPGLQAGQGRVLVVFQEMPNPENTMQRAFLPSLAELAKTLQPAFQDSGVAINAIRLPVHADTGVMHDLVRLATWLTAPSPPPISGTLLQLDAPGD